MLRKIIIAGSGPVGSFIAVLCTMLGFVTIVYEKRTSFTRNINLKLESDFFKDVYELLIRLNVDPKFFEDFNLFLKQQNQRIQIKDFEEKFATKAKELGAVYITRNVDSFSELYEEHKLSNPIILDCTGRNSTLRINEFGADSENVVSLPLQNAMHINFKAKLNGQVSLYQVMKYIKHIKLSDIVVGKVTDDNGYQNVTIPVFISEELGQSFDKEFPDINRNPLNPFNTTSNIEDLVFYPITALLGNLLADGCEIDFNSVSVKKIMISCGYAKKRNNDHFICLGDAAVHLAFFRSLNLGLKHALDLFVNLTMMHERDFCHSNILMEFKNDNPHLNPVKFYPTEAKNVYMVVTKVIFFGCFSYCFTNRTTERLTNAMGINECNIPKVLEELNRKLRSWSYLMIAYERVRDRDIEHELKGNQEKNVFYDHTSWLIGLNGKSFIKVSELSRAISGKYPLFQWSFEFMLRCFRLRKTILNKNINCESSGLASFCSKLVCLSDHSELWLIREICEKKIPDTVKLDQLRNALTYFRPSTPLNFQSSFVINLIKNEINSYRVHNEMANKVVLIDL